MKNLSTLIFVAFYSFASLAMGIAMPEIKGEQTANIEELRADPQGGTGPIQPWPWGYESPFPWAIVQGVWAVEKNSFKSYFTFRIVKRSSNTVLEVKQIDPQNCNVLAAGIGFLQSRIVRAQMSSKNGGTYRLTLRSFAEKLIDKPVGVAPVSGQYVVLSVIPFDTSKSITVPMEFISNSLSFQCRVQQ